MQANFPIADRNRLICNAANQLLRDQAPTSWHFDEFRESDFGFDMVVQVEHEGGVKYAFFLQLKGTESPTYVKEDSALSFGLKRRTLNLYANQVQDTLLVVAVIELDERGKLASRNSHAHWQWMSVALEDRRGSRYAVDLSSAESSVVHVPLH